MNRAPGHEPADAIGYPLGAPLLLAAGLGALASLAARSPAPVLMAPLVALLLRSRVLRARARSAESAQRSAVVDLCGALRAELQAGRQPAAAFAEAIWCRPELGDVAARLRAPQPEQSTPDLLAAAARGPGRAGLASLGACWRAAERHGVPLVGAVTGIEDGLRAEHQRHQGLAAQLAGVRTTVALLGVLPGFGLALGSALGADPLHTLLTRPIGEACLIAGFGFEVLGLLWTDRLVASVDTGSADARPTRWRRTRLGGRTRGDRA